VEPGAPSIAKTAAQDGGSCQALAAGLEDDDFMKGVTLMAGGFSDIDAEKETVLR
jgi:hypothetical protein